MRKSSREKILAAAAELARCEGSAHLSLEAIAARANVSKGGQARFNTANGTWTGAAQSATVVTIPGAQFDEDGSSGAVGVVRYRRPVPSVSVSG